MQKTNETEMGMASQWLPRAIQLNDVILNRLFTNCLLSARNTFAVI
jgi:hypothetical protein